MTGSGRPSPTDTPPLHEQVYLVLRERIQNGTWAEGERVPTEKALMSQFGVSRATIRQAFSQLRAEGAVVGGRGAPPRVHRVIPGQSFDTFMSFTEWANSLGRTPDQHVVDTARRAAGETVARELGIAVGDPVVTNIRARYLDGEPAMLERSWFPLRVGLHLLTADLDHASIYQTLRAVRITPVRARHRIDAVAAHQLDAEWLEIDRGAPLLRSRRVSYDGQNRAIEYADDRYLPATAAFVIENSVDRSSPSTHLATAG
ncbi:GntR family transcriptional regulator [Pseudoclavibacter sp. CFCC 14310]|uniref:GntR family transcriptional regulator n=1 Tax=Pseudoclavibacter sp. CFCC 14310 TaxID=2615180 RepID=UPI001300E08E|nr:GntR family transcriptional regulator [Pseudoclavibacter sp. CFCC 14310]KAB1644605.1 GntR family transcriptional regulator [Pseudoclavibacter sp. CFCC 14310]